MLRLCQRKLLHKIVCCCYAEVFCLHFWKDLEDTALDLSSSHPRGNCSFDLEGQCCSVQFGCWVWRATDLWCELHNAFSTSLQVESPIPAFQHFPWYQMISISFISVARCWTSLEWMIWRATFRAEVVIVAEVDVGIHLTRTGMAKSDKKHQLTQTVHVNDSPICICMCFFDCVETRWIRAPRCAVRIIANSNVFAAPI